ncbi:chaperone modulator CbpM [Albibacterium indicum]|uniref:chaperone modulator CbpM n=1 Tax=Albibacterium indicum TaxID=2292082 RepID=UPI000E51C4D8|nr:chaperone modulator CbpM [Pedobacter indicus]
MKTSIVKITEYCSYCQADLDFVNSLEEIGLIETSVIDGERFIHEDQLRDLDRYANWHYEMEINIEGIDALRNAVTKIQHLQSEILYLKEKLRMYEP